MVESHHLTLPQWLTLTQAAQWLTGQMHAVGVKWTADCLLATLCTSVGPLSEIHESLPLWLAMPPHDFRVVTGAAAAQHTDTAYIPVTNETASLFYVRAAIDSAMVRVRLADGTDARLAGGSTVSRDWLVVRGFELPMFLRAWVDVQKAVQARLRARDAETPEQHRRRAADLYAKHQSYAEVGRRMGVTGQRARQLVNEANPIESPFDSPRKSIVSPIDVARKAASSKGRK